MHTQMMTQAMQRRSKAVQGFQNEYSGCVKECTGWGAAVVEILGVFQHRTNTPLFDRVGRIAMLSTEKYCIAIIPTMLVTSPKRWKSDSRSDTAHAVLGLHQGKSTKLVKKA